MKHDEAQEIIECLPKGRTKFYYFKDRYAPMLLGLFANPSRTKGEIRRSNFRQLLDKPVVKSAIRCKGGRSLTQDDFGAYWPAEYQCYFLSLDVWGSGNRWMDQTSRPGYNLVLQMNFSGEHNAEYESLIRPSDWHPFEYSEHPISIGSRRTLAWARLDIDPTFQEALIEEIQNDWIRKALWYRRLAARKGRLRFRDGTVILKKDISTYVDTVLSPHIRSWDEAMLSATIWFLRKELGVEKIYYHTHKTGADLKKIQVQLPPKSIYSKLPRKFCFSETDERPDFLHKKAKSSKSRKALESARFHIMQWQA